VGPTVASTPPRNAGADHWRAPRELELTPILAAAREAFSQHGFDGTSVRDIASRVGVTVPALYYHYENKEAILFALLDASIERLYRLCVAAVEGGTDPVERLLNLVDCIVAYMAGVGKSAILDAEIRALSPDARAAYSRKRHRIETMLVEAIEAGVQTGAFEVRYPADTARALLGMFQAIPMWFRLEGKLKRSELAQRYRDIVVHTLGATAEAVARADR
jgi:AcrR family transcriptional regulator